MNRVNFGLILAALFAISLSFVGYGQEMPAIAVEEGSAYPDFVLPTVDGEVLRLSDFRGKKILLFHFASW